jgi:hypothetical protein
MISTDSTSDSINKFKFILLIISKWVNKNINMHIINIVYWKLIWEKLLGQNKNDLNINMLR